MLQFDDDGSLTLVANSCFSKAHQLNLKHWLATPFLILTKPIPRKKVRYIFIGSFCVDPKRIINRNGGTCKTGDESNHHDCGELSNNTPQYQAMK